MIYLDHAATTPLPEAVADTMYDVLRHQFGNPSAQYPLGREAKELVEEARRTIAGALGCQPSALHFTSCGTESDNWAIRAAAWQGRHTGRHIITTAVEHSAVLEPCRQLEQEGYEVTYLKPDRTGHISAGQVAEALREDTVLVSVMLVNNETGCLFPVADIARLLKERGSRALLHCDAVQGFLKVPCAPAGWGVDLMSLSAHKIGGPKGIGALYVGPRVRNPRPLLPGGGQEDGLRSGTEATAQIAGFAKAVELRLSGLEETLARMASLRDYAVEQLSAIPDVQILGGGAPHILALSLAGWPSQNIVNDLGAQGICISAGSACHQGKPSHVVAALKLAKRVSGGVIRLSFGPETTRDDIDQCAAALRRHHDTRMPML